MRRAIIWKEVPKHKIELKYLVVEQIELNALPQDSILGDVMLVDERAVDLIQDWQMYKAGLHEVYEVAIDSMKMPKNGSYSIFNQEGKKTTAPNLDYGSTDNKPFRGKVDLPKIDKGGGFTFYEEESSL